MRALEAQRESTRGRVQTALALKGHDAAGFTEIVHFEDGPEPGKVGWQGSTLGIPKHCGYGLGARLKIANHARLGETSKVARVYTWNAVENSWMLAINDRAGFATWGWVGLWKKRLA